MARLTRIHTGAGDRGETSLGDGQRLSKDHPRIQCLGDVDELNACIGLARAHCTDNALCVHLERIQHQLFELGGDLALPGRIGISNAHIEGLENLLQEMNRNLPPLEEFVLPGGSPASAHLHLARAVCRRAERNLWHLARSEQVSQHDLVYLNRLSDLLFILSRILARQTSQQETQWKHSE